MDKSIEVDQEYLVDGETLLRLRSVATRLYDDRPLSGDQRRDLANKLDALLYEIMRSPIKRGY